MYGPFGKTSTGAMIVTPALTTVTTTQNLKEQDKSSDIEQQPPSGTLQINQYTASNVMRGVTKPTKTS